MTQSARKNGILTRREIEGLIADGAHVFILDGKVFKVDAWLKFHPGGEKPIKHMVGRDATDEINAYVPFTIPYRNSPPSLYLWSLSVAQLLTLPLL